MKHLLQYVLFIMLITLITSCASNKVDLEQNVTLEEPDTNTTAKSEEELEQQEAEDLRNYFIQEDLKVQDMNDTVVYIDRPVYIPTQTDDSSQEQKKLTGKAAVVDSLKSATMSPDKYKYGTFYYHYDENFVYEIYTQPYHLTDIILQPGELVKGSPLFSEDEQVWELTANVSVDPITGLDIQHLFIKPAYSKQDSTLIVITDKHTYHFRVKSFSDTHMAMVKFQYPNFRNIWATPKADPANSLSRMLENDFIRVSDPTLLSFDYKMKYSMFHKPEFLPTRVYDDGRMTYIQIDTIVLQKKLPVMFNERNEIINYSVKKNVIAIPRLVNKLTLRLGKQKVVIEKKKTSKKKAQQIRATDEANAAATSSTTSTTTTASSATTTTSTKAPEKE